MRFDGWQPYQELVSSAFTYCHERDLCEIIGAAVDHSLSYQTFWVHLKGDFWDVILLDKEDRKLFQLPQKLTF